MGLQFFFQFETPFTKGFGNQCTYAGVPQVKTVWEILDEHRETIRRLLIENQNLRRENEQLRLCEKK